MASEGNKKIQEGIPQLQDAFVVIVKTAWNAKVVDELEAGACKILNEHNISYKTTIVPGAVELPFAVKTYAESSQKKADAFITLGAVVRGDTPHFDYVCKAVTEGITQLNIILQQPVIFGVLTVNNWQQAVERIGGSHGHKGEEAAFTAIKMIELVRKLKQ